jgi:hypothetical protein
MFVHKKQTVNTLVCVLACLIASGLNTAVAQDANTWCKENEHYHPCNLDKGLVKEEFHEIYPLTPTGRVLIENINGRVHIFAWDLEEVKVDAVKSGRPSISSRMPKSRSIAGGIQFRFVPSTRSLMPAPPISMVTTILRSSSTQSPYLAKHGLIMFN